MASSKKTVRKSTKKTASGKKASGKRKTARKKVPSQRKTASKKVPVKKAGIKRNEPDKTVATNKEIAGEVMRPASSRKIRGNTKKKRVTHVSYDKACELLQECSCEISKQRVVVQQVFEEFHDELFSHPNVCGLHVGLKRSQGKICHPLRYCIRLHVRKKWQEGHPMLEAPIDVNMFKAKGVELDIVERSYQSAAALKPPYPGAMLGGRPIVKFADPPLIPEPWGTMGMIVFTLNGQPRYLTNKHVAGEPGSVVRESSDPASATYSGQTKIIGEVESSIRNARVDCAIIKPTGSRAMREGIMKPDELFGLLPGKYATRKLTAVDEHQTKVFKIGASTGFQPVLIGIVKNVNTSIEVNGLPMTGQIIVESTDGQQIIHGGDSGSIAIVEGRDRSGPINFVVGLVHAETVPTDNAESGDAMVANHFDEVQSALRIKLFQG